MSREQRLISDAVRQQPLTSGQGWLQKMFAAWFDGFVYNQIWEDPAVDLRALKLDADSRILTISSGGCNALNYLLAQPASVTAVDLNRHHIFLLRLKMAALKFLPSYEDFFNFFGCGTHPDNVGKYQKHIAPRLDEESRKFWEGRGFRARRINYFQNGGLYNHSRNGYFLRFFHRFSTLIGCRPAEILKAETPAEQEALFQKYIAPFFDSFLIKTLGKLPVTMFGLGIPPQQYEELKKDLGDDDKTLLDIYRERAHRLACDFPIQENYFAWQAFARKYDTENHRAVPDYLKSENFARLKQNVSRLQTGIGSVTDEIKRQPRGAFNRFVFLDAQDWMNRETLTELWTAITEKAAPQSRIIFRTASRFSPAETKLPSDLREKFNCEKDLSRELFTQDRASIYGGFHLYILK